MFYVKRRLSDSVVVTMDIHDDDVFTRCPNCGKEVGINLAELFRNEDCNLYNIEVFCAECSEKIIRGGLNYECK